MVVGLEVMCCELSEIVDGAGDGEGDGDSGGECSIRWCCTGVTFSAKAMWFGRLG